MKKVLYFGADWCSHCKAFMPIVKSVCESNSIEFNYIDVDDDSDKVDEFNIRNVPTLIVYDGESMKARFTGTRSKQELEKIIL